jgi:hypothetical protein
MTGAADDFVRMLRADLLLQLVVHHPAVRSVSTGE